MVIGNSAAGFGWLGKAARKHASGVVFLLAVFIAVGCALYFTISWMFDEQRMPLSKMVLQGKLEYIQTQDVQQALSHMHHIGTFMSQDVNELQQIITALPWVAQASIRKQWPDTIKIYLTEHRVAAIWNGYALLNENGDVFEPDLSDLKEEKVKLYGPEGRSHEVLQTWEKIAPLFHPLGLTMTSLVLNDRLAWQIILDNGIRLELGKESLEERVNRFITLYSRLGKQTEQVSYIDLRYDTGAAVGWFPEQDLAQENTDD
ncbi:cell division protein FtsQ/DivIB [Vibrio sp. HA2012]|uniref:cell division protein FtsQ/DivIB n=1 Tax=Vibrio sp. HA2012 TaxID=1971595 RepID=UPI001E57CC64|nr:cell division protein FtsQ/DivIB [Vibrio sp. HA2012]